MQESACLVRSNWQRINHVVLEALEAITLEHMTQPIGHKLGPLTTLGAAPEANRASRHRAAGQ